ncbi:MAG: hypothetical protein O2909_07865 [Chloroflexi bacterium]|nr:hypothetical protein [Chloroflexota bacterium]
MSKASTIKDITSAIRKVEETKKQIDKELENLRGALTFFESMQDESEIESAAEAVRNAIYDILKFEHPLHRNQIYERLREKGIVVTGKEPVNNVGAHLSLDARFDNVGKGMWTINEAYIGKPKPQETGTPELNKENEKEDFLSDASPVDELLRNNGISIR